MDKLISAKVSCMLLVICAFAINLRAQTVTTIANFSGFTPSSPVAQGTNGNFYGETSPVGIGTGDAYEVTPGGALTNFGSLNSPFGGLVLASNGLLYGTDQTGGTGGTGSVFKMTSTGTITTIHSFCLGTCADGADPSTALIQVGGVLYGTTTGTIYKITFGGTLTTLHNFCNPNCNQFGPPYPSELVAGSDGNFYGTTEGGNVNLGTVFKMTPSGKVTTLHTFSGTDGSSPSGSLVQGPDGAFYGMTVTGGNNNNSCSFGSCGTVFKITTAGTLTTLHKFDATDGGNPAGSLVLGTDGNSYGTTEQNGSNGAGTLFQITAGGALTTLYDFCSQAGCLDGANPGAALMQATNGMFYGTTRNGGNQGNGVVYSLSMGLGPFVQTNPNASKVGSKIIILGNGLTGSTSVTFNGTSAAFTVVSDTEITATVPSGATKGKVEVVTPTGKLDSNSDFRVLK